MPAVARQANASKQRVMRRKRLYRGPRRVAAAVVDEDHAARGRDVLFTDQARDQLPKPLGSHWKGGLLIETRNDYVQDKHGSDTSQSTQDRVTRKRPPRISRMPATPDSETISRKKTAAIRYVRTKVSAVKGYTLVNGATESA